MQLTLESNDLYYFLVTSTTLFVVFSYLCFRVLFKYLDYEFGRRRLDHYDKLLRRLCRRLTRVSNFIPNDVKRVGSVCTGVLPELLKSLCDYSGLSPLKNIITAVLDTSTQISSSLTNSGDTTYIRPNLTDDFGQESRDEAVIRSEYNATALNRFPRARENYANTFPDPDNFGELLSHARSHYHNYPQGPHCPAPTNFFDRRPVNPLNNNMSDAADYNTFTTHGQQNTENKKECPFYSMFYPHWIKFATSVLTALIPVASYFVTRKIREWLKNPAVQSPCSVEVPSPFQKCFFTNLNRKTPDDKPCKPLGHWGWLKVVDRCELLCNPKVEVTEIDDAGRKEICDYFKENFGENREEAHDIPNIFFQIHLCDLVAKYWPDSEILAYIRVLNERLEQVAHSRRIIEKTNNFSANKANGTNEQNIETELVNRAQNIISTWFHNFDKETPTDTPTVPQPVVIPPPTNETDVEITDSVDDTDTNVLGDVRY